MYGIQPARHTGFVNQITKYHENIFNYIRVDLCSNSTRVGICLADWLFNHSYWNIPDNRSSNCGADIFNDLGRSCAENI